MMHIGSIQQSIDALLMSLTAADETWYITSHS